MADCRHYADLLPTETGKQIRIFHAQFQGMCKTTQFKRNRTEMLTLHSTVPQRYSLHAWNPQPRLFQLGHLLTLYEPYRDTPERFQKRPHSMAIIGCTVGELQLSHGHNYVQDGSTLEKVLKTNLWEDLNTLSPLICPYFLKAALQQHNPRPATFVCVSITYTKGQGLDHVL